METRSKTTSEFNMLKSFLEEIGVYEHGLNIAEMRNIYTMIKESIEENAGHNFDIPLDSSFKFKEQEIENNEKSDFSLSNMCCNSTMIIDNSEVHTNIIESGFQSSENISLISPISSPDPLTPLLQSCNSKNDVKINKNSEKLEQNPNTDKDSGVETSGIKSNDENEIKQLN